MEIVSGGKTDEWSQFSCLSDDDKDDHDDDHDDHETVGRGHDYNDLAHTHLIKSLHSL